MSNTINSFQGTYRFLSNFWSARVYLDGVWYPSTENAFQAAKTLNPTERAKFVNCSAVESKKLGRAVTLRLDWEDVKIDVMRKLLMQKFSSGELRQQLLETGDAFLIEGNNWGDRFWGMTYSEDVEDIGQMTGLNHLGKLLMEVREHYRRKTIINEVGDCLQFFMDTTTNVHRFELCKKTIARLKTL